MSSSIHLIRHGLTEGIVKEWFYGSADLPLLAEGFDAIEKFKAAGIYPECVGAEFYTSGMLRANQTLEAIYGSVPYTPIPDLAEISFGSWECKSYKEIALEPEFEDWKQLSKSGEFVYPDGGESFYTFKERVMRGWEELMKHHRMLQLSNRHSGKPSVSVVTCHGGTISVLMSTLFPDKRESFWDWTPKTARGYTLELENSEPVRFFEI